MDEAPLHLAARHAATLNALPAHIAIIDAAGVIVEVNAAWRNFADANTFGGPNFGVGLNYLSVCDQARGEHAKEAAAIAQGIRSVLAGVRSDFSLEYACHAPSEKRWFRAMVAPLATPESAGAVVMHVSITQRKLAEDRLAQSERYYRTLFASNPQPMWVYDIETLIFLVVNDAAVTQYGYSHDEFIQLTIADIRPLEDVPALKQNVESLGEGIDHAGTWRHQTKDGRILFVEISSHTLMFMGRRAEMVLAVDMTARIKTEHALREREALLSNAQRIGHMGSWDMDLLSKKLYWPEETCELFGIKPEDFPGTFDAFLQFVLPEYRHYYDTMDDRAALTGGLHEIEYEIRRPDGSVRWMHERGDIEFDDSGKPVRRRGMVMDITERKAQDEALRESEQRFRNTFRGAATGMVITSPKGRFLAVNEAYCKMLGYTEEELLALDFITITHPEDREANLLALRELAAGRRESVIFEKRYVAKGGRILWARVSSAMQFAGDGTPVGAVGVIEDITQQREAEIKLRDSEALLRIATQIGRMGAWSVDVSTNQVTWSPEVYEIHEISPDYCPTVETAIEFYPQPHRGVLEDVLSACIQNGQPFDIEVQIITARGRQVWARSIGEAVRDQAGQIVRVQGAFQDITDSKLAQQRELELEERLAGTLESMAEAFFTLDTEWRFSYLNPEAERVLQRPRATLLGKILWEEFPETVGNIFDETYHNAMTTQQPEQMEAYYPGLNAWFDVRAFPSPTGLAVYFSDITDKRNAQQILAASEERFRLLAKATNDAVWDWDTDTSALWWSGGIETLFGYRRDLIDSSINFWKERIHPQDRDEIVTNIHAALDGDLSQWSGEYRFLRKDGRYAYVLDRGYIMRNSAGRATRMIGGMTDLSERKEFETRLADQAALLDQASDAIMVSDLQNRVVYWNRRAETLYGWLGDEARGCMLEALLFRDPALLHQATAEVIEDGNWTGEMKQHTRQGEAITVLGRWTLLRDETGAPKSILAIYADITERKKLEDQLLRAQRLESIGTLASGIAHDLNNILAPILMSIELLRDEATTGQAQETLNTLESSAKRGADLVRQVLGFARGMEAKPMNVNPTVIIRDVQRIITDTFPKNIELEIHVPEGLWRIFVDPTQFHQVLMNLCVNARDAMPTGGKLKVYMKNMVADEIFSGMNPGSKPGPYVIVGVTDTGVGMTPETRDKIFEPFFTTKDFGKGTGLGLSTTFTIVKNHGGFFNVYSEPGRGSKFKVYLPAIADSHVAEEVALGQTQFPRGEGELILLVDDEESIRQVTKKTLERFGYRVMLASNGAEAIPLYVRHQGEVAVILTDMNMPIMDGPALIVALKSIDASVRIIGSSGLGSNGAVAEAMGAGVEHFIPKPYSAEALLATLWQILHPAPVTPPPGSDSKTADEAAPSLPPDPATPPPSARAGARILVVDDNVMLLELTTRMLANAGHTVTTALDGQEAMLRLEEAGGTVDLIITDLNMPLMSGEALFREVNSRYPAIKFIFSSGEARIPDSLGVALGTMPRALLKPYTSSQLKQIVWDTLNA